MFADHKASKALLNSPHPSGKLARWGLSIQELDLHIHYHRGRKNEKVDTLSRSPCSNPDSPGDVDEHVVAVIESSDLHQKAGTCLSLTYSIVTAL